MSLIYSRVTPFGFINPANATEEDNFYGEPVELQDEKQERHVLAAAEYLRGKLAESASLQTRGFDSQAQAVEMVEVLRNVQEA